MAGDDVDPTHARIAALEARIEQLEAERAPAQHPGATAPRTSPVSRRRLLGMAGATAAGAAGAVVLSASPAGATHQPEDVGIDLTNNGTGHTVVSSSVTTGAAFSGLCPNGDSNGIGVHGDTQTGPGIGVRGTSNQGVGVYGESNTAPGVTATSGVGISLLVMAPAANVNGTHLKLDPGSIAGPPTGGAHTVGQFWMDSAGVFWQCVVAGPPGKWVRQSPLVTLPAPVRVYDSRSGQPNQSPNTQGALSFTSAPPSAAFRDVACNKDASSGTTVVPANATTLLMNLTVISLSGVGALVVYATGAVQPSASSINWSAGGQVLANGITSACNTSQHVDVAIVAGAGASTNFLVDVVGYYL